jgi:GTPase SAR1 family protein
VDIGGEKYFINLWDTAGQEKYHALNQMYYR